MICSPSIIIFFLYKKENIHELNVGVILSFIKSGLFFKSLIFNHFRIGFLRVRHSLNNSKKKGVILEMIEHPRLQYRVKFGQAEAVLYHEELTNGNQRDVPIKVTDNQEGWEADIVE
ncbi:hypothetical protein DOZ91_06560 [Peribacillus frigoritolerans]|nr:hypothetical protein DOZ91_06560 [Peribacillus frigoritolerans]